MISTGITFKRKVYIFLFQDGTVSTYYLSTCWVDDNYDESIESIEDDIEVYIDEDEHKLIFYYLKGFDIHFTFNISDKDYENLLEWPTDKKADFVTQFYDEQRDKQNEMTYDENIWAKLINLKRYREFDDALNPPTSFNKDLT